MTGPDFQLFLYLAEDLASQSVEFLEDTLWAMQKVQKMPPQGARSGALYAEGLVIEFLEKALEKRRLME